MKLRDYEAVYLARLRAGISQQAQAAQYGISQSYLSQVEWGRKPVPQHVEVPKLEGKLTEGEGLRLLLRRKGFNMQLAAARLGMSEGRLLRMMRGQVAIPEDVVERLAALFK